MQLFTTTTLLLLLTSTLVSAHARLKSPQPLGWGTTPALTGIGYNAPLLVDGTDFPCKNTISTTDMTPTAIWTSGSTALFELQNHDLSYPGEKLRPTEGQLGAHSGGSCQVSLSFDLGKTWKVLHSYIGGCPRGVRLYSNMASDNQVFEFNVPQETRAGDAVMAWSWIARTGNRMEFYMNCAAVKIEGDGKSTLDTFPDMYLGEVRFGPIGEGMCRSVFGENLEYPNPGSEERVTRYADPDTPKAVLPTGKGPDENWGVCKAPGGTNVKRSLEGRGRIARE